MDILSAYVLKVLGLKTEPPMGVYILLFYTCIVSCLCYNIYVHMNTDKPNHEGVNHESIRSN